MNDSSLMLNSRFVITRDALDSIAGDGKISVVATGSSMTFKALDGRCVANQLGNEVAVYNIAHVKSMPWNDMIHIPRLIQSNPDIVLIEIGPNILPGVTVFDQTWESGWVDEHFFDRNHLDDEGRAEFCARLAPVLEQMLED